MSLPGERTFSVEVVGFSAADLTMVASAFALSQRRGYRYVQHRAYPRRPDVYLVDADDLRAIVRLEALHPTATHPAMLIGSDSHGLPWPRVARPLRWLGLLEALDRLVDHGDAARAEFPDRNAWPYVDRRATPRLDIDLDVAARG